MPDLNFNINVPATPLIAGETIIVKLQISSSSNNFTSSFLSSLGSLFSVNSLSSQTGYASTVCPFLSTASISASDNELVFSLGVSSFHDFDYTFVPNPLSGSVSSSLYSTYGEVSYPFIVKPSDIVLIYLSDGTYAEFRIKKVYKGSNNLLRLMLDKTLSPFTKEDLIYNRYKRILILTRIEDETSAYLTFSKSPGQTSYGFIIPNNLAPDILSNIDTITKQVKQKLLSDQQGQIQQQ